jgi:hypothetical protein
VRLNNSFTLDVAPPSSTFEGLSSNGRYLFYSDGGDISRFDTSTEEALPVTTTSDATVVAVSPDGAAVFFLSLTDLTPGQANPVGAEAQPGAANLYVWSDGAVRYITTVTPRDVEGEIVGNGAPGNGLGLWAGQQSDGRFARVPVRVTATGGTFFFESRADVTGFDSAGHSEIYRYAASGTALTCISCAPSNERPTGDAHLQTVVGNPLGVPIGENAQIRSMAGNGERVFFESEAPLVQADTNGRMDVYEWESGGTGSCFRDGGCIFLISSGISADPSYLFGASESGNDVFILTSDRLVSGDFDPTSSVYDARVLGGSASSTSNDCLGEGCRGQLTPPPVGGNPASAVTGPSGNLKPPSKCPKGKRQKKQHGKVKCVKKHKTKPHKKQKRKQNHAGSRGGAK